MPATATRKPARKSTNAKGQWHAFVIDAVAMHYRVDRFQPMTLTAAYDCARAIDPTLTLGGFHDGLRDLRDAGRIRLIPFTRAYATIPDARNALYLDGEVMYYISPC